MKHLINRHRRRGSAAIEFAFWLPIVVLMMSGLLDFGWYMANQQNVMQAARDGARTGAATNDDPTTTGVNETVSKAKAAADWIHAAAPSGCAEIDVTEGSEMGMSTVRVEISCTFTPLVGALTSGMLPPDIVYAFEMFGEVQ